MWAFIASLRLKMEVESVLFGPKLSYAQRLERSFRVTSWDDKRNRAVFFARALTILFFGSFIVANAITGMALPDRPVECFWDALFNASESVNLYLQNNSAPRDALLICSSLIVDFLALTFVTRFLMFAVSWRSIMCLMMFYGSRALIQVNSR